MEISKGYLQSVTMWGLLVALLSWGAGKLGWNIPLETIDAGLTDLLQLIGLLVAGYGRKRAKSKLVMGKPPVMPMLLVVVVSMLAFSGCAHSPAESGRITAQAVSETYLDVRTDYLRQYEAAEPDVQEYMRSEIAPLINSAQRYVVLYSDAVVLLSQWESWRADASEAEDAGEAPPELNEYLDAARLSLIVDDAQAILQRHIFDYSDEHGVGRTLETIKTLLKHGAVDLLAQAAGLIAQLM